ncbi:hypothetical protein CR513_43059, partial [Mucuna pruriens]
MTFFRHKAQLYVAVCGVLEAFEVAKEYFFALFRTFMNENGMLRQSSCVDTPSQNGVDEHKSHHPMEVARALLFETKVPKSSQFFEQTYSCQPKQVLIEAPPKDTQPLPIPLSTSTNPHSNLDLPIALHKNAFSHGGRRQAMEEEMMTPKQNETWDLISLHTGGQAIGYKWVYTIKMNLNGFVARLKACLVAKRYAQTYGNVILHDFQEEVYVEQPPGFVAQRRDSKGIDDFKNYLQNQFQTTVVNNLNGIQEEEVGASKVQKAVSKESKKKDCTSIVVLLIHQCMDSANFEKIASANSAKEA